MEFAKLIKINFTFFPSIIGGSKDKIMQDKLVGLSICGDTPEELFLHIPLSLFFFLNLK
jgi:hypothetical protein